MTFWNDLDAEEDWRRHTADRVLNMKPRKGSVVMMRCKFQNETMQNATGYSMYYNGLVKIKPDGEHDEENRNVVFGTVSSLKDVTVCGSDAVRANVYVGKRNVNGVPSFHYVTVTLMNDLAIMARTDLAPVANADDTITRKKQRSAAERSRSIIIQYRVRSAGNRWHMTRRIAVCAVRTVASRRNRSLAKAGKCFRDRLYRNR